MKTVKTFLSEGDVVELNVGMRVYASLPMKEVYANSRSSKLTSTTIELQGRYEGYAGEYVVYKTAFEGGGTGHGPHDVYPDGHHVYLEKVDDPQKKVDFYQSGCFTVMHESVPVLRRLKRQWNGERPTRESKRLGEALLMHARTFRLSGRNDGMVEDLESAGKLLVTLSKEKPKGEAR